MFDIGFSEVLLVGIAALIAVGPKDIPEMLFKFGRMTRQMKIFTQGIRNQYAEIMHEVEVEHYRKEFKIDVLPDTQSFLKPPAEIIEAQPVSQSEPIKPEIKI